MTHYLLNNYRYHADKYLWPCLLTWINTIPRMDKLLYAQ